MAVNKRKLLASAQRHVQKGALDRALKDYLRLLEADPRDANVRLKVGDLQLRRNQPKDAIDAYLKVADQFMRDGFDAKAVAIYKQVTKIDGKRYDVYLPLSELYQRLGLISEAMAALQSAADGYQSEGKRRDALDLLRKMSALDPSNVPSRLKVADLLAKEDLKDEAVAEYDAIVEEAARQDDWETQIAVFERILEVDPQRIEPAQCFARLLLDRNQNEQAEHVARKCVEADAERAESNELLGEVLTALGKTGEAVPFFKQAAKGWRELGDEAKARDIVQRYVSDDAIDFGAGDLRGSDNSGSPFGPEVIESDGAFVDPPTTGIGDLADPNQEMDLGFDADSVSESLDGQAPEDLPELIPEPVNDAEDAVDAEQLLAEASVYVRYGKHEKAIEAIHQVLQHQPANIDALEQMGDTLAAAGHDSPAVEAWVKAGRLLVSGDDSVRLESLRSRIAARNEQAAASLSSAGAAAPDAAAAPPTPAPEAELELEEIEIEPQLEAEPEVAADAPAAAAERDDDLGLEFEVDFDDDVEVAAESGQEGRSTSSSAQIADDLESANALYELGNYDEAELAYQRILELAPNHPGAQLRLGEIEAVRAAEAAEAVAEAGVSAPEAPPVAREPAAAPEPIAEPAAEAPADPGVEAPGDEIDVDLSDFDDDGFEAPSGPAGSGDIADLAQGDASLELDDDIDLEAALAAAADAVDEGSAAEVATPAPEAHAEIPATPDASVEAPPAAIDTDVDAADPADSGVSLGDGEVELDFTGADDPNVSFAGLEEAPAADPAESMSAEVDDLDVEFDDDVVFEATGEADEVEFADAPPAPAAHESAPSIEEDSGAAPVAAESADEGVAAGAESVEEETPTPIDAADAELAIDESVEVDELPTPDPAPVAEAPIAEQTVDAAPAPQPVAEADPAAPEPDSEPAQTVASEPDSEPAQTVASEPVAPAPIAAPEPVAPAPSAAPEPTAPEPAPAPIVAPEPATVPAAAAESVAAATVGAERGPAAAPAEPLSPAPAVADTAPPAEEEEDLSAALAAELSSLDDDSEDPDEASFDLAAELSEALSDDPGTTGSAANNETTGSLETIFGEFKRGVEATLGEGDVETHFDLGIAYREMGLFEDAIGEFQHGLESERRRLDSLHMMALCALELDRPADAMSHLEQALSSAEWPEDREAPLRFDLGRAYVAVGDPARALDAYRRVAEIDPSFGDVTHEIAALEAQRPGDAAGEGDLEAYESFDDLIEATADDEIEGMPNAMESFEEFADLDDESDTPGHEVEVEAPDSASDDRVIAVAIQDEPVALAETTAPADAILDDAPAALAAEEAALVDSEPEAPLAVDDAPVAEFAPAEDEEAAAGDEEAAAEDEEAAAGDEEAAAEDEEAALVEEEAAPGEENAAAVEIAAAVEQEPAAVDEAAVETPAEEAPADEAQGVRPRRRRKVSFI